ncbi:hypothetical protein IE53DRAFT_209066 [Violaceomyces palustris]|uniref:Uncharacterized protein n=1 Tax=Violaceomyces palustris TaxID=1673888 RepID=A0ACD0NQW6_9BASI|nr:hypothetical protein IE53DRAFT_209066 [Violaceomyces palustris]
MGKKKVSRGLGFVVAPNVDLSLISCLAIMIYVRIRDRRNSSNGSIMSSRISLMTIRRPGIVKYLPVYPLTNCQFCRKSIRTFEKALPSLLVGLIAILGIQMEGWKRCQRQVSTSEGELTSKGSSGMSEEGTHQTFFFLFRRKLLSGTLRVSFTLEGNLEGSTSEWGFDRG